MFEKLMRWLGFEKCCCCNRWSTQKSGRWHRYRFWCKWHDMIYEDERDAEQTIKKEE